MRTLMMAALLAIGSVGPALAQGDVIAARREGLRGVGANMEAIAAVAQARGDARPTVARIDEMTAFFRTFGERFPTASLTPPVAQGTQPGQTRALAAIDGNRAGFETARANMVTALGTLRTAAEAGSISPDLLRATGGTCGACHQQFRAR